MLKNEETVQLVHRNLAIVVTFAFSRTNITTALTQHFHGNWKYLEKSLCTMAERRADRAMVEMATQIRMIDDVEQISEYLRDINQKTSEPQKFGRLVKSDTVEEPIWLRDFTNKIIHANRLEWRLEDLENPLIVSHSNDPQRWLYAEISLIAVMAFVGALMH